jgi:hypothetical protein
MACFGLALAILLNGCHVSLGGVLGLSKGSVLGGTGKF